MQTNCPNCSNRLVVDDAKVPPTPFMLKCPKCQGMVKLPGRSTPAPSAGAPAAAPPAPPAPPRAAAPTPASRPPSPPPAPGPPAPAASPSAAAPAQAPPAPVAPVRAPGPPPPAGSLGTALLGIPAAGSSTALSAVLSRLGFSVEPLDPFEDKILRLQHGEYALVAATRNGVPEDRNVCRFVQTLPPEIRRRVFFLLLGDELQTGEGNQAFALTADLVLHPKDLGQCDRLLFQTLHERKRLYQTFWDAEDRKVEGKL